MTTPTTKAWIAKVWDDFRTGFWFVPSLIIGAALVLAVILPEVDVRIGSATPDWIESDTATARATLTAIGSAMITVAGVVFSVTVVTLSITSSQFGPRLLRLFLSDPVSQLALGCCLGSSLYSLLLLRTLHETEDGFFVPHLSVSIGVILSAVTVAVLIYFIHRVSVIIQADNVVAHVAHDLDDTIDRIFPNEIREKRSTLTTDLDDDSANLQLSTKWTQIAAEREGYLQAIDHEGLVSVAKNLDLFMRLERRPGDFVVKGNVLASVHAADRVNDDVQEQVQDAFLVGNRRTPRQDVECAVVELVELAVRALSPGINDPFTAMRCVDRLGASLSRLAQRELPSFHLFDGDDQLRIVVRGWDFGEVLDAAFDMIRQNSAGNVAVTIRLLESLTVIAEHATREDDRRAILRQANMILSAAKQKLADGEDLNDVRGRYKRLSEALESVPNEPQDTTPPAPQNLTKTARPPYQTAL